MSPYRELLTASKNSEDIIELYQKPNLRWFFFCTINHSKIAIEHPTNEGDNSAHVSEDTFPLLYRYRLPNFIHLQLFRLHGH